MVDKSLRIYVLPHKGSFNGLFGALDLKNYVINSLLGMFSPKGKVSKEKFSL